VHGFPGYVSGGRTPTLVQVLDGRAPANTAPIRVAFTPGSKWQYSGGGYTVMQQWVLDVSGQPFPEYMRQAVLEPLGMNASTFEQPLPNSRAEQAATGHSEGQPVKGRWHVHPEMAAAGLWTTPSDIARFAIGVQAALAGRDHRVISQQLARDMVTRQIQEDGLGVFVSGSGPALRFDHGGRNVGFDTQMVAYAEAGLGAVIMLNANDNTGLASRVLDAVAVVYQWPDYPVRKALEPIEDKEPELTAKVRRIFDEIRQGRIERALFTRELAFTLVQQMASELRAEMIAYGALQSIALVGRSEERGLRVYRYQIVFAEETILVTCTVLSDGRISGLTFRAE
jgi:CubicO group peptidase (beta-lactamase class C family)